MYRSCVQLIIYIPVNLLQNILCAWPRISTREMKLHVCKFIITNAQTAFWADR